MTSWGRRRRRGFPRVFRGCSCSHILDERKTKLKLRAAVAIRTNESEDLLKILIQDP
jgi:hypothetical protein